MLLADDRNAVVAGNAALTVRQGVLDASPQLAEVFAPSTAALRSDVLRRFDEHVEVGGELPDDVAEDRPAGRRRRGSAGRERVRRVEVGAIGVIGVVRLVCGA